MAWTTPKTWVAGEALTATDLNTHLRDNLEALKAPPTAYYECDESADYTTTSTSFVDVDAANLKLSLETSGGDVLVGFIGSVKELSGDHEVFWNIAVDDVDVVADDGICFIRSSIVVVSFAQLIQGLDAGIHTFALRWKVVSVGAVVTLYAGAGTASADVHPSFWVREI